MRKIYLMMMLFAVIFGFAQVGINTTDPQATLDVNGNLIVRTVNTAAPAATYDFLVTNNTTKEVEKINGNLSGTTVNTTLAKATEPNGISLLDGSLFAGWQKIDFDAANVSINPGSNFSAGTDFYTVPSTGIYKVTYEFRYGTGVQLALLNFGGTPRIGILRHDSGGYTVLDERTFSGANLPMVASILISNSSSDSVYQLNAGDQLSFEVNAGGIVLDLLSSSFATFYIYKISD